MLSRGSLPRQHAIETPSTIQASRLSNRLTGGVTTTGIYQVSMEDIVGIK